MKSQQLISRFFLTPNAGNFTNRCHGMHGHAVDGGLEIALACDLRIARRNADKVGLPEITLGVLPGTGGTLRLARALPKIRSLS